MITEIASIDITPDSTDAFERAVAEALPLFRAARGCSSVRLEQCLEEPLSYRLVVDWETLEHHIDTFRASSAFARWRELVSPYFAKPPHVVHTKRVLG